MKDERKSKAELLEELRATRRRVAALEAGPLHTETNETEREQAERERAQAEKERAQAERERGQAEEERSKSELRFRRIVEASPLGMHIYELRADGRLVFCAANPAADRILGVENAQFIGKTIEEAFPPLIETEVPARYRDAAARGVPWRTEQIAYEDGTIAGAFEVTAAQIDPGRMVAVFQDITERKQAEEHRSRLEEQLRQAQKMEAIGRLAGGVAHDFNNVLCTITGTANLLLEELPAADPLRGPIEDISEAADRAADLTRQLLAFSRKQVIDPKVINLSHVIERMHPMLTRLIGEDVILRTMPQKRLGRARVDPGQIEQIVLNLAINARDAMPDGGELLIETANVVLGEDYCQKHLGATPGPYVMLAVSDTGAGMSAEVRQKIFEPFFTTKQLGQGTGLGLAMVFGIVDQSGGRIEVYSELGEGTSFKVYFPRVGDRAETLDRVVEHQSVGGTETILVVEDEEVVRKLTVRLLERRGYNVLASGCGADALALAERHQGPIDLLLTDVVMPHMNGRELSERFVALRPETKVLYTSGYTQNVIAHHGVLDEGVQFIAKPYSLEMLSARVRDVLDKK